MREDAARCVDFYVVSADNVVGWSGRKMPGLNFCPSPSLVSIYVRALKLDSDVRGHLFVLASTSFSSFFYYYFYFYFFLGDKVSKPSQCPEGVIVVIYSEYPVCV